MVQLESGDLLHFYAAATPGWVANGNYAAVYIVLDNPYLPYPSIPTPSATPLPLPTLRL